MRSGSSKARHGHCYSLRLAMANTNTHTLHTRFPRPRIRIPMKLYVGSAQIIPCKPSRARMENYHTVTQGAPFASLVISISFMLAPAPLPATPRDLKTASLAHHRPANDA